MEREKVLDRIRKLLALATSPNEHEAAAAAAQAQQLLHRYALSMADVAQAPAYKARKLVFPPWWLSGGRRQFAEHLTVIVVNEAGCAPLADPNGWYITGEPGLLEGASLLLDYLFDILERLTVEGYRQREADLTDPVLGRHPALDLPDDRRSWMHGYLYGALHRLGDRFIEARQATITEVAEGSQTSLVAVGSALERQRGQLVTWLRTQGVGGHEERVPLRPGHVHPGGVAAGRSAGDRLPMAPPKGAIDG